MFFLKNACLLLLLTGVVQADVVKPALVEVSIFADKTLELNISLSIEAAMSGIGTQYKKTTDAPNSDQYDELRALKPDILRQRFAAFEADFLNSLQLSVNSKVQKLTLVDAQIDIVGYKKRPRKTQLIYRTQLSTWPKTLAFQYDKIYGDSALRWQVYKKDSYNWSDWQWLRSGNPSGIIDINHPNPISTWARFTQFISIGFDHVIPLGWDHILFIIGMALWMKTTKF